MQSTFEYYCAQCGGPVTKAPLMAAPRGEPADGSLGTWRCKPCHAKVKVRRCKRKEEAQAA